MKEIAWASAAELARAVRQRRLSPVEIADALLARLEIVNPGINAYVHVDADRVRRRARDLESAVMRGDELGVLHGVPYSIKDLTPVAGLPLTLGLAPLRDQIAPVSAVVAERLERAGGCLLGWMLTYPFNMMASVPAATVPCGVTAAGLPVGLQLVARPRDDAGLLRAAASFECARPWSDRRPVP
jgi:Asp-tRNA(Asn)/Glu-tRNA(Gln) amidotransferase A subunit family amidase